IGDGTPDLAQPPKADPQAPVTAAQEAIRKEFSEVYNNGKSNPWQLPPEGNGRAETAKTTDPRRQLLIDALTTDLKNNSLSHFTDEQVARANLQALLRIDGSKDLASEALVKLEAIARSDPKRYKVIAKEYPELDRIRTEILHQDIQAHKEGRALAEIDPVTFRRQGGYHFQNGTGAGILVDESVAGKKKIIIALDHIKDPSEIARIQESLDKLNIPQEVLGPDGKKVEKAGYKLVMDPATIKSVAQKYNEFDVGKGFIEIPAEVLQADPAFLSKLEEGAIFTKLEPPELPQAPAKPGASYTPPGTFNQDKGGVSKIPGVRGGVENMPPMFEGREPAPPLPPAQPKPAVAGLPKKDLVVWVTYDGSIGDFNNAMAAARALNPKEIKVLPVNELPHNFPAEVNLSDPNDPEKTVRTKLGKDNIPHVVIDSGRSNIAQRFRDAEHNADQAGAELSEALRKSYLVKMALPDQPDCGPHPGYDLVVAQKHHKFPYGKPDNLLLSDAVPSRITPDLLNQHASNADPAFKAALAKDGKPNYAVLLGERADGNTALSVEDSKAMAKQLAEMV
ncbi:MAG: mitochondrial fission ELM1 family protein, partial [Rickettsiales bacterium]|nr:mitochondrial fission ELM1 family protein [Rickettsiales bacterium]